MPESPAKPSSAAPAMQVPLLDLKPQYQPLEAEIQEDLGAEAEGEE